ncbi:MAG TPA: GNAT family N-acetyltransferase [Acidimicrobiales bacterium]|nr:GNAT family N-acetyltransferase [Acidimicrobiales bacterium]
MTDAVAKHVVTHNPDASRYELRVDGELVGIADYTERGDTLVFPHTEIDRARRGQGLGAVLVQGALDDVRCSGRRVVPSCWYVAQFIDEHPAYRDLLAP